MLRLNVHNIKSIALTHQVYDVDRGCIERVAVPMSVVKWVEDETQALELVVETSTGTMLVSLFIRQDTSLGGAAE